MRHKLLEKLTDDAIAKLYMTKFSTISPYLTKLHADKYSEIRQNLSHREVASLSSRRLATATPAAAVAVAAAAAVGQDGADVSRNSEGGRKTTVGSKKMLT